MPPGARVHVPVFVADFPLGCDGSHFPCLPALPRLEAPWQVRRYPKKVVHRRLRATDPLNRSATCVDPFVPPQMAMLASSNQKLQFGNFRKQCAQQKSRKVSSHGRMSVVNSRSKRGISPRPVGSNESVLMNPMGRRLWHGFGSARLTQRRQSAHDCRVPKRTRRLPPPRSQRGPGDRLCLSTPTIMCS